MVNVYGSNLLFILSFVRVRVCVRPQSPEEGIGSSGAGVPGRCEPPCGSQKQNSSPLQEQQALG